TEDRGDLMERVRQNYLAEEGSVGTAERAVLLQVTSVFERIIWMSQRLARSIERGRDHDARETITLAEPEPRTRATALEQRTRNQNPEPGTGNPELQLVYRRSVDHRRLAILVGGGPAPGINSVIAAATIRARLEGLDVIGIRDGFEWLMQGDTEHTVPLTID